MQLLVQEAKILRTDALWTPSRTLWDVGAQRPNDHHFNSEFGVFSSVCWMGSLKLEMHCFGNQGSPLRIVIERDLLTDVFLFKSMVFSSFRELFNLHMRLSTVINHGSLTFTTRPISPLQFPRRRTSDFGKPAIAVRFQVNADAQMLGAPIYLQKLPFWGP